MGAKKKQTKQTKRAPVAVAADDGADNALLDAMIAANLQAAAAAEEEFVMAGLDLIAPGQFAREAFPGLASSCAMCGRAAAALPCSQCKLRLSAAEGSNTGVADPRQAGLLLTRLRLAVGRYCGKECQQAAWRLCHKRTRGAKTPTPTPPKLARAGSVAVVEVLHEFGRGCASLTDLCLLRLSMSITKEGRRYRLP